MPDILVYIATIAKIISGMAAAIVIYDRFRKTVLAIRARKLAANRGGKAER